MTGDGKQSSGSSSAGSGEIKLDKTLFLNVGLPLWQ